MNNDMSTMRKLAGLAESTELTESVVSEGPGGDSRIEFIVESLMETIEEWANTGVEQEEILAALDEVTRRIQQDLAM